jgi:hypothetical protein
VAPAQATTRSVASPNFTLRHARCGRSKNGARFGLFFKNSKVAASLANTNRAIKSSGLAGLGGQFAAAHREFACFVSQPTEFSANFLDQNVHKNKIKIFV